MHPPTAHSFEPESESESEGAKFIATLRINSSSISILVHFNGEKGVGALHQKGGIYYSTYQ